VRSVPAAASRLGPASSLRAAKAGCEIVVVGAHGGAGTTTLATLLQTPWDMGTLSRSPGGPPVRTGGRPLVLVSRNTTAAAARATAAVNVLSGHGCRVCVLAVISDGLPDPAAAAYRFRVLAGRVGAVVRVPFIARLRAVDDPAVADLPGRACQVMADIKAAALGVCGHAGARIDSRGVGGYVCADAHPGSA